jgi:hypothetical protein
LDEPLFDPLLGAVALFDGLYDVPPGVDPLVDEGSPGAPFPLPLVSVPGLLVLPPPEDPLVPVPLLLLLPGVPMPLPLLLLLPDVPGLTV